MSSSPNSTYLKMLFSCDTCLRVRMLKKIINNNTDSIIFLFFNTEMFGIQIGKIQYVKHSTQK